MLKRQEKRLTLKPFILAYQEEGASQGSKGQAGKQTDERIQDTRRVIKRVVERVKRI